MLSFFKVGTSPFVFHNKEKKSNLTSLVVHCVSLRCCDISLVGDLTILLFLIPVAFGSELTKNDLNKVCRSEFDSSWDSLGLFKQ